MSRMHYKLSQVRSSSRAQYTLTSSFMQCALVLQVGMLM